MGKINRIITPPYAYFSISAFNRLIFAEHNLILTITALDIFKQNKRRIIDLYLLINDKSLFLTEYFIFFLAVCLTYESIIQHCTIASSFLDYLIDSVRFYS